MPLPFYLSCLAILVVCWYAWEHRQESWGLPACMVLGTVSVWYIGDVFYNDYASYGVTIGKGSLVSAWWQVLLFVIAFGVMVIPVHRLVNSKLLKRSSSVVAYLETNRLRRRGVQRKIDLIAGGLLIGWLILMVIALVQVKGNAIGLFAPYLGQKVNPWARGQIGGGFSALISFAEYLQVFFTASFGVLAAVAMNRRTRAIAIAICFFALPFYLFDRTRNTILVTMLPGILAFVFLRLRSSLPVKLLLLGCMFMFTNLWFSLILANRSGMSLDIGSVISGEGLEEDAHHAGLNMFEELAWINHLTSSGRYIPNFGSNYLAVLANPIPRGLWKNKPTMGLDYALARGQVEVGSKGQMSATISMGLIGQGVANFGGVIGPPAAALLVSLWVAFLARQDLKGADPGRMIIYGGGMIGTFNLGRDFTLIALYPFLLGWAFLFMRNHYRRKSDPINERTRSHRRGKRRRRTRNEPRESITHGQ